jgi:LacI family transcriptional regulator
MAINEALVASWPFEVAARIEILESLSPQSVADQLRELSSHVQAIAVATADHPKITAAVSDVLNREVSVLSLLSDFAQGVRNRYVGLDHRKVGRTAGWLVAKGAVGSEVAILVEGQQFAGHEIREISFMSYLREHAPHLNIVKSVNADRSSIGRSGMEHLLGEHPGLAAIYIVGVGMEGAVDALREATFKQHPFVVGHELTSDNRAALADRVIDAVIATPLDQLCRTAVAAMVEAIKSPGSLNRADIFLDLNVYVSENI